LTVEEITKIAKDEFGVIFRLFTVKVLKMNEVRNSNDPEVPLPGVYVYLKEGKVIKVGRHIQNSRKRALEHIRDNTNNEMKLLDNDPNTTLILYNVKRLEKIHWLFSLEVFLEKELEPTISSKRTG
jgi:hypothetical protein